MDDRRFDALTRALGGASTRRGALAALAGVATGLGLAGRETGAKKKRKRCSPECAAGQTCTQGTCTCDNGGAVCGASCCRIGQECQAGQCVELPEPTTCVAYGEPCKNVGAPCCEPFVCGSGQGGKGDVACYVPAGGACATTAECVYDSTCKGGACVANPQPTPTPTPAPCGAFQPTGDPATDGAALDALLDAAVGASDTVISLATGVYAIDAPFLWSSGNLTIQACDGEQVTLTATTDAGIMFPVADGSLTLKDLAVDGGIHVSTGIRLTGPDAVATLDTVTVTNMTIAVMASAGTVTIVGGSYSAITAALADTGGAFTCSGSPQLSATNKCFGFSDAACGC